MRKITIVGAGNVGATAAQFCFARNLGDVVLMDVVEGLAKGKALDFTHTFPLVNGRHEVTGTSNAADTADSDVVVITAGIARKPGMSRDDLLKTNGGIVTQVVRDVVAQSPDAVLIVVSNPLDVMCLVALKASGLPPQRVIGMSGILDSARLRSNIATVLDVPASSVQAIAMGEHGDGMVCLVRLATVGGVPATDLLTPAQMKEIAAATTAGGGTVTGLMGTSAFYAPGMSIATLVEAVIMDTGAILPCSAYLTGQYGAHDIYMCVPAKIGARGVETIYELKLNHDENSAVARSVAAITSNVGLIPELQGWCYSA